MASHIALFLDVGWNILKCITNSIPNLNKIFLLIGRVTKGMGTLRSFFSVSSGLISISYARIYHFRYRRDISRFINFTIIYPKTITKISRNERSEEKTSELQSLMRTSYTVFCLKKKKK